MSAVYAITSPAAEQNIDRDNAESQIMTMDKNVTITLSGGFPGQILMLQCVQDSTGSRTLTLGASVGINVAARTRPVLSTGAEKVDMLLFLRKGTVWTYVDTIQDV